MENQTENYNLLVSLSDSERGKWLRKCTMRKYSSGERIVRKAEQDYNLYLIKSGEVRVMAVSTSGREVGFANLRQGENFGELSLLDGKLCDVNVIATTTAVMVIMSRKVFTEMLLAHTLVQWELLRQMAVSTRQSRARRYELITLPIASRIHKKLLRLSEGNMDFDKVVRIKKMPTHARIAADVGCKRESVSRELKCLEKQGILSVENRVLKIHSIETLQEMVDEVMDN